MRNVYLQVHMNRDGSAPQAPQITTGFDPRYFNYPDRNCYGRRAMIRTQRRPRELLDELKGIIAVQANVLPSASDIHVMDGRDDDPRYDWSTRHYTYLADSDRRMKDRNEKIFQCFNEYVQANGGKPWNVGTNNFMYIRFEANQGQGLNRGRLNVTIGRDFRRFQRYEEGPVDLKYAFRTEKSSSDLRNELWALIVPIAGKPDNQDPFVLWKEGDLDPNNRDDERSFGYYRIAPGFGLDSEEFDRQVEIGKQKTAERNVKAIEAFKQWIEKQGKCKTWTFPPRKSSSRFR